MGPSNSTSSSKQFHNSDNRCLLCFNLHAESQTVDFDTWYMTHGALCANWLLLCCVGLRVYLKHPTLKNVLHSCFEEEMLSQRISKGLCRGTKRGTASNTLRDTHFRVPKGCHKQSMEQNTQKPPAEKQKHISNHSGQTGNTWHRMHVPLICFKFEKFQEEVLHTL